eukprot:TRINITY_DN64070_c0_g1_i1.p1 TRINITY_DN64070_c0_g1~~TRINITY_DN64070_c0_g1_i1.p1  ORF type:complete len:211 (+),score=46.01 TRINITY_DN64070_c0_g1_i1:58-633(+)
MAAASSGGALSSSSPAPVGRHGMGAGASFGAAGAAAGYPAASPANAGVCAGAGTAVGSASLGLSDPRAVEREYRELLRERQRGEEALHGLERRVEMLRAEVEEQRRRKPTRCNSCKAVTLQTDAAAQSLLGAAGHVARTLLRDAASDRAALLDTVLRYIEPVKHLDPELEELYDRADAGLRGIPASPLSPP